MMQALAQALAVLVGFQPGTPGPQFPQCGPPKSAQSRLWGFKKWVTRSSERAGSLMRLAASMGLTVMGAALSVDAAGSQFDKRLVMTGSSLIYGVYDPAGDFRNDSTPKIEHIFIPWEGLDSKSIVSAGEYAHLHKRSLLITIEPWTWLDRDKVSPHKLYEGIMDSHYDGNIEAICSMTAKLDIPVIIRWGQEMDNKAGHFVWAKFEPWQYIDAYRHVVDVCRHYDKRAKYMWSPMGNLGLQDYYPGSSYVDFVGVSLFALEQFDRDSVGHDRTFQEIFEPIYQRLTQFHKPIYISELGYEGSEGYVRLWSKTFLKPYSQFPLLKAVIYFNQREVYPWQGGYGQPNWRVLTKEGKKH